MPRSSRVAGARVDITGSSAVFRAELKKSGRALKSNARQMAAARRSYRRFTRQARDTLRRLASLRTATTALVATGAGLALFSKRMADANARLVESARTVNLTVETYQGLQKTFEADGVAAQAFDAALVKLDRRVFKGAEGLKTYATALRLIGVETDEIRALPMEQKLMRIADAFAATESEEAKTLAATELFGVRAAGLIQVLERGAPAIWAEVRRQQALGVVTNENAQRGKDLAQAYTDVGTAFKVAGQNIVGSNAQSLIGFLQNLTVIAPKAEAALTGIADKFERGGMVISGAFAGLVGLNLTTSLAPILGPHGAVIVGLLASTGVFVGAAEAIEFLQRSLSVFDVQRFGSEAVRIQERIHELQDEISAADPVKAGFLGPGAALDALRKRKALQAELVELERDLARIRAEGGIAPRPTASTGPAVAAPIEEAAREVDLHRERLKLAGATQEAEFRRLEAIRQGAALMERIRAEEAAAIAGVANVPMVQAQVAELERQRAEAQERAAVATAAHNERLRTQKQIMAEISVQLAHGVVDSLVEAVRTGEDLLQILRRIVLQIGLAVAKERLAQFITGKVVGVPGAASGGVVSGVVQVHQDEIIDFRRPARVHSAEDSAAALRGMGGGFTYAPTILSSDGPAVRKAVRDGFDEMKRQVRAELIRDLRRPGVLTSSLRA